MTGKERAALRKQANTIDAIFQIGKEGLTGALLQGVDAALEKRELVKLSVLESCRDGGYAHLPEGEVNRMATAQALEAELIQCIGRKFVLYRQKEDEEQA